MPTSLARMAIGALLAVISLIAVAAFFSYRIWVSHVQQDSQRAPAYAGKLLAQQIVSTVQTWSDATRAIAQAPLALRLLQSKDEAERRQYLTEISSLHPQLGAIQIIGVEQIQQPVPTNLNSWQLQTLRGQKEGLGANPTLHAESPMLTLIEPVRLPSKEIVGYVLVSRSYQDINQLINASPLIDGYVELQQANGQTDVLFKRGNEQLKTGKPEVLPLAGTPWQLLRWSKSEPEGLIGNPLRAQIIVSLVLALLISGVFFLTYFMAQRALRNDVAALTKLFSDITHNRMRKNYAVHLQELKGGYHVMYQLGKLMIGKHLRMVSTVETDHLSQVNNRRSFEAKQREVFARVNAGWAHSLLILDIDNFKQVNDTYGHEAGDQLIVQFGQALKKNLRGSDFVARLGGDEFCVIFPNTPLAKAAELATRLRDNMPKVIDLLPDVRHQVHWSGGLSEYSKVDKSENAALARADQALLDAKRNGRNRTETKLAA